MKKFFVTTYFGEIRLIQKRNFFFFPEIRVSKKIFLFHEILDANGNAEEPLPVPPPVRESPKKTKKPSSKYKPSPIVGMISKHTNGTLNLWNVMFTDKSKFTNLLNIRHKSRASGHR